ncbi:CGNR zinc finger domain-containing protein [Streptomyces chiangmaiensis]|uniref:ABATE domain-containing protein n=1 Tax=Streptomyces chiangmaiensis TaxID=766497 RepID=A0ABU7FJP6_9ACTN|nr:ABATE domain-containing protein [Streptomyces chiangmaiensis]MED7824346.1 ABATE domain-containing protein [Streptomyces chiangmaiensis]
MATDTATASYELRFDSGRTCLDLLATTHPEERLDSVERLRAWIAGTGLVPVGTPLAEVDAGWLSAFRELRFHVGELVRGELAGKPADGALAWVNAVARGAPPAPCAVRSEDGALVRRLRALPRREELLAAVARETLELLTDPEARARLRQCEGDSCPIVYLDTSRGRRRRWCSSEVCGNRERVARHRRRAALARA